jgi:uncharacterized membrane protein YhaH (DUF805 family)
MTMEHGATQGPAAGWYDDPGGSTGLRYWTGTAWSADVRPAAATAGQNDTARATSDPRSATVASAPTARDATPEQPSPVARILDVLRQQGGRTAAALARETGLATSEVARLVQPLLNEGRIGVHGDGMKRYYLPDDPTYLHLQRNLPRGAAAPAPVVPATHPATVAASNTITDAHGNVYRASAPPAPMSFTEAISRGWREGLTFQGRAGRPEYWWFALFAGSVVFVAQFLPLPLFLIVAVVLGVPHLAVGTRRLHDTGRSGNWLFWAIAIPVGFQLLMAMAFSAGSWGTAVTMGLLSTVSGLVVGIVLVVLLVLPGDPGPNFYGRPPTGSSSSVTRPRGSR